MTKEEAGLAGWTAARMCMADDKDGRHGTADPDKFYTVVYNYLLNSNLDRYAIMLVSGFTPANSEPSDDEWSIDDGMTWDDVAKTAKKWMNYELP